MTDPAPPAEADAVVFAADSDLTPPVDTRPLSRAASLGLLFGLLPFAVNLVANIMSRIVEWALTGTDTTTPTFAAFVVGDWIVVLLLRLLIAAFVVLALWHGFRALAQTKDGSLRGRTRAKWAIVLGFVNAALLLAATVVLIVHIANGVFAPA